MKATLAALAIVALPMFANASVVCQSTTGNGATATLDTAANVATVTVNGNTETYAVVSTSGNIVIAQAQNGSHAILHVTEGGRSLVQALGTSFYAFCTAN